MATVEWWKAAKEAVAAYTGMTPVAFFTAVAVAAALYFAVSGLLARPAQVSTRRETEEERTFEPLPPPVQLGEVTEEALRAYDGSDPKKPLLMAIKGQIYDVTQSRMFYGPGGPYALFAGRDASRALAKMSFEPNDLTGDVSGLDPFEVEALQEWEYKFKSKYVTVGTIKKTIPVAEGDTARSAVITERDIVASTTESNNHVSEPNENGATNQASVVEKPMETPGADVITRNHEDVEKAKGLLDLDVTNTSSHEDAEKPKETPEAPVKNKSSTEDEVELKGTPQVADEKNTSKPEIATEKPKEATDAVDMKNTTNNKDSGQAKETQKVDEKDVSSHEDGEEKPKKTSDVEVENE